MINNCISMSFPGRLIVVFCMVVAVNLQAEDIPTGDFSDRAEINQRLLRSQNELQQHASDSDRQTYEMLQRLETAIFHHQAALDFLAAKEAQRERAEEVTRSWNGFDQQGPWLIMFSDDLRMQLISLHDLQRDAEARNRIITQLMQSSADQLSAFQRTERELTEKADTAESGQQVLTALQRNDISSRTEVEIVTYLQLRQRGGQAELAALKAGQELLELQLKSIKDQVVFSQSELDDILRRIEGDRRQALETLEAASGNLEEADIQIAWQVEFLDAEERFWKTRHSAFSATSRTERKKAQDTYRVIRQMVDVWAKAGKTLTGEHLIREKEGDVEQVMRGELQRIRRLQNRLDFAISEIGGNAIFGISLLDRVVDTAFAIWGAELYLVEDTTSFEGKRVTTYRAITLGKLIRLAFILTVGWFTLKFLSRRVRKLISRRQGSSPATANSVGRWTFGVGLGLLTIYGLKWVHIPFTAFAFLGGTLAIGIGFGAQTLVKNFISGLIIILERPFKIGDLIEVDNVTGQIQRIGLRASVIEHFDGIETLVPNSILLDNRVDNWTFGQTAIRGSVHIGVSYGSSTREVSRTMLAVALEHGQVLERPEPEVRLEDFGDNALVFRLLFWVDATKIRRERLASDLRFMLDKALNEAGITISFPQRDIHFDSTQPLQVEVHSPPVAEKPETTDK